MFLPAKTLDKVKFVKKGDEEEMAAEFDVEDLEKKYGGNLQDLEAPFWPPVAKKGQLLMDKKYREEKKIDEFYVLGPEEDNIILSQNILNTSVLNVSK